MALTRQDIEGMRPQIIQWHKEGYTDDQITQMAEKQVYGNAPPVGYIQMKGGGEARPTSLTPEQEALFKGLEEGRYFANQDPRMTAAGFPQMYKTSEEAAQRAGELIPPPPEAPPLIPTGAQKYIDKGYGLSFRDGTVSSIKPPIAPERPSIYMDTEGVQKYDISDKEQRDILWKEVIKRLEEKSGEDLSNEDMEQVETYLKTINTLNTTAEVYGEPTRPIPYEIEEQTGARSWLPDFLEPNKFLLKKKTDTSLTPTPPSPMVSVPSPPKLAERYLVSSPKLPTEEEILRYGKFIRQGVNPGDKVYEYKGKNYTISKD